MLRVRGSRLNWSETDVLKMTDVIGADEADRCRSPIIPSLIKLAKKKRIKLDPHAQRVLADAIEERRHARLLKALPDATGNVKAFAHQRVGVYFMRSVQLPAYLIADQTGVGKTLQALEMIVHWRAKRVLIICPNKAKHQWAREVKRWLGQRTRTTIVEGTIGEQTERALADGIVIGHWESLVHADAGYLARSWDLVVLDEAHRIGNLDAQRTQTAHALKATHKLALTAHPYTNDTVELFSILRWLYPREYKSKWRFVWMHVRVRPKPFGGVEFGGPRRPKLLKWEIAPFTLRRMKSDVYRSLPPITRQVVECPLSERGLREYARLKKQVFVELDGLERETKILPIINDLSRTTRLRQYLVDPGLVGAREPSAKYPLVLDWLDDLDGPPVLFTSFRQAGERLREFLKAKRRKMRIGMIAGGMKSSASDKVQRDFLAGKFDLLIAVTAAASESLNLGKYGYVGHLDLPWNPRTFEQTEGRVDRPEEGTGKLVPTTSWRFIVPDSYEERLEAKLEKRHEDFGAVFTVGELRRLFE